MIRACSCNFDSTADTERKVNISSHRHSGRICKFCTSMVKGAVENFSLLVRGVWNCKKSCG